MIEALMGLLLIIIILAAFARQAYYYIKYPDTGGVAPRKRRKP